MVLALFLALSFAAQGPASPDFQEGRRLYFDLEYELAVFRFRAAARDEGMPAPQRALVHAWLGLAYAQVAEMQSARESFADALALDPEVALPSEASPPPKALELLEEARVEARLSANGPTPQDPRDPPSPASEPTAAEAGAGFGLGALLMTGGGLTAGLGVLALGAGAGLGVVALSTAEQGNAARFQDEAAAFEADAQQSALAANLSFLLGGALVSVGALILGVSLVVE